MTHRTSGWLSWTAWFGALATMGSACAGNSHDFASRSGGAGGDSAAGGTGGSDAAGIGSAGESDATGGTGGSGATGGSDITGGTGGTDAASGTGGSDAAGAGSTGGSDATGGTGGSGVAGAGMASGMGGALGGIGGALVGAAGAMAGDAGGGATDPYAPRSGPFRALVYSKTSGFRHNSAIEGGLEMFTELGSQFDFEVTASEDFVYTAENLAPYELVVFLNPTGNNLDPDEKVAFEDWMLSKHGAFVGTHAAADNENGWSFYSELTGQYHDGHAYCCSEKLIEWEPYADDFPGVNGLPSPWRRAEEWLLFNDFPRWSTNPGFKILSTVQIDEVTHPVSFAREFMNFRSFYTSLGHESATYRDASFRQHIAGGLLWSVRREHLLQ